MSGDGARRGEQPMNEIAREAEAWLQHDVPREVEALVEAAAMPLVEWRSVRFAKGLGRLPHGEIPVFIDGCAHPCRRPLASVTPADLELLADVKEHLASSLEDDADRLRGYARDLEAETPLGQALTEHFATMLDENIHRRAALDEARSIANAPGGVQRWEAVDEKTRDFLERGGLLRIADAREAMKNGTLSRVEGIGPARVLRIAQALAAEA